MCPPGVDQTTRTAQKWTLLAPKLAQRHSLNQGPTDSWYKPLNFLSDDASFGAFAKLARLDSKREGSDVFTAKQVSAVTAALSPLESLPGELLANILSEADMTPRNVLAVGACSQILWSHAMHHIRREQRRNTAPWANTPLMCSGTWLTDLPSSLYEMFPEQREQQKAYETRSGRWYGPRCPARRWNWNVITEYEDLRGRDSRTTWLAAFDAAFAEEGSALPKRQMRRALETVFGCADAKCHRKWVLRNLTTHQMVRLEVDSRQMDQETLAHVSGAPWLSLHTALLLRICWGTLSGERRKKGKGMGKAEKLARGSWAGHCFDVVEEESGLCPEWKDVTEEIVREGEAWRVKVADPQVDGEGRITDGLLQCWRTQQQKGG